MGKGLYTRWDLVRKICGAGLLIGLWVLGAMFLNVWVAFGYNPDAPKVAFAVQSMWFLVPLFTVYLFAKVLLHSPEIPFWFVPAAGILSLLYFFAGAWSLRFSLFILSGVLAFVAFEMRKDLWEFG